MAQISVNHLTFYYDGCFDNIFEDVSFSIDTSWKLGFIGRNGKGKTTFLNLLLGKYEYKGSISTTTVFDYFPYQVTKADFEKSAAELMEKWKPGVESWRVLCELGPLSLNAELLYRPFSTLSFGERTKLMLAVLFSGENDFLLIDEPTNHLDSKSREIIKAYLASKQGFILVSHDRDLLDACIDHVLVLNRETIEVKAGNFSTWWENKERANHFAKMENEKHMREIKNLKAAADRSARWAEKNENSKIGFDPNREPDRCIDTRAYIGAKTKKMQARVSAYNKRMDREIEQKEGLLKDIEEPVNLKIMPLVHYKKNLVRVKDYSLRYENAANPVFERVQFEKNMEDFSEGQKKKVLIAASLLTPAHLYIWDEPLNYIDVFSRMQIERLIEEFNPTMLLVEHDVRFKEKLGGRAVPFQNNVPE